MPRNELPPEIREEEGPGGSSVEVRTHPAFGQISIAESSGGRNLLHGSDFQHQYRYRIEINRAEVHRHLSTDWHHTRRGSGNLVLAFEMSKAQWAELVSAVGQGAGIPCTLTYTEKDGLVPSIAETVDRRAQFALEVDESLSAMVDAAADMDAMIDGLKISNAQRAALKAKLSTVQSRVNSSIPFIKEQFGEFMEETVSRARRELTGMAQHPLLPAPEEPKQIVARVRERPARITEED